MIYFEENELLSRYYPKVVVLIDNQEVTLIPAPLFDSQSLNNYLKFNHFFNKNTDEVNYDKLSNLNAFKCFCNFQKAKIKIQGKICPVQACPQFNGPY